MRSTMTWVAVAVAAVIVLVVGVVIHGLWGEVGDTHMSGMGWFAMVFGILVTLALGVGLMTLIFISNRRGYDEPGRDEN